jgi:SAM-dependent methyltransferase
MQTLDEVASKYLQPPTVEVENDLIMQWYPKRVKAHFGHVETLLELGLGHGYTVPFFAEMCDQHHVVEGSERVITHFKKNNPRYEGHLHRGYFETFEPEGKFDLIVMGFVLEHVTNPVKILERYREFLMPNGRIIIAVPNAKSLNRRLGHAMGMIDDIYSLNETDHILGHQRNYCRDTLRADIEAAGLTSVREEGIYLKPFPLNTLKTIENFDANLAAMLVVGIDFPELCVALLVETKLA